MFLIADGTDVVGPGTVMGAIAIAVAGLFAYLGKRDQLQYDKRVALLERDNESLKESDADCQEKHRITQEQHRKTEEKLAECTDHHRTAELDRAQLDARVAALEGRKSNSGSGVHKRRQPPETQSGI